MSIAVIDLIAGVAVAAVLLIPALIRRRVKHGEARFDSKTGKVIDDE
ncbi:hypothetical protein [Aurantiacibacter spongiae]|nr:hypothetical protein [Aurantiacibacter spongiae]